MAPRHRDQRRPGRPGRCALLAATLGVGMAYPLVVLLANTRASAPEAAAAASAATAASMRRLEERRARAALPRAAPPAVLAAWPLADDELRDDGDGGVSPPTETKRCPDYSGPGFRFERFPMKERELIRIEVPFDAPPLGEAERPRSKLEGLPLSAVVLTPGTRLQRAQASDLEYLLALDHDALLWSWRTLAKLPTRGAQPLTGWEHPGSELRGHFLGHWLSAAAALIASLDHAALAAKARAVVAAIAECQAKLGTGYVSAFPDSLLDRFEEHKPVWAPLYTLHKVLAGLLDMHELAGSEAALGVVLKFGEYAERRAEIAISKNGLDHFQESLNMEYGGFNEVLWRLAALTGERRWSRLASLYDKRCFVGAKPVPGAPAERPLHPLDGLHANTHLPIALGAARRHALTGEAHFARLTRRLYRTLGDAHAYATGGTSHAEMWGRPHELGEAIAGHHPAGAEHQESCTTYNHLRLADVLLTAHAHAPVAEFIERAVLNGILGTQRGLEPGELLYFLPLGSNVSKRERQAWRLSGWAVPHGDFWCCSGTGIENFARLNDRVWYTTAWHSGAARGGGGGGGAAAALLAAQLVPSRASWAVLPPAPAIGAPAAALLEVELTEMAPLGASPVHSVSLRVLRADARAQRCTAGLGGGGGAASAAGGSAQAESVDLELAVRVPGWARAAAESQPSAPVRALFNRQPIPLELPAAAATEGGGAAASTAARAAFAGVRGQCLQPGDTLELQLPLQLRAEPLADARAKFRGLHALLWGPLVLAVLSASARGGEGGAGASPTPELPYAPADVARACALVPDAARTRFKSLVAPAGALAHDGHGRLFLRRGDAPRAPFRESERAGGTDELGAATFAEVASADGTAAVAFAALSQPGCYIALAAVPDSRSGAMPAERAVRLRCDLGPNAREARWRRRDGFVPGLAFYALESEAAPGLFLSAHRTAEDGAAPSGPASLAEPAAGVESDLVARKPPPRDGKYHPLAFARASTFELHAPLAQLPAGSFWCARELAEAERVHAAAAGAAERAHALPAGTLLLVPLNEVIDERYSVYVRLRAQPA